MVTEIALFESPDLTAFRIQEREDQLRRTTCDLCLRVAKYVYIEIQVEFSYIYSELHLILSFMCKNLSFKR